MRRTRMGELAAVPLFFAIAGFIVGAGAALGDVNLSGLAARVDALAKPSLRSAYACTAGEGARGHRIVLWITRESARRRAQAVLRTANAENRGEVAITNTRYSYPARRRILAEVRSRMQGSDATVSLTSRSIRRLGKKRVAFCPRVGVFVLAGAAATAEQRARSARQRYGADRVAIIHTENAQY